ncbi:hypothetical protein DV701_15905 [Ornithinimicrobium avium]|uniref:non-specific serine/threonine protein kinase n=1 Tax=Ornithinimicrobium avium TaxID=2283195 RepID=A0A345NQT8_9MICO|nr:lanthionine synthetase LanC family protein [Ornithinimicrobium avium]AXH97396.1 hypothetical protein DV701_15905 [Ornithinimicrobium avium]
MVTTFEMSVPLRSQGWKLHVAAHPGSSPAVLERVLPVLRAHRAPFKVAESPQTLMVLNAGAGGPSQIGKFVTVYPQTDEDARQLALDLDAATEGMAGPRIPSDRPLRPGSLVHYRFGSFTGSALMQLPDGTVASALLTPSGTLEPDQRLSVYSPPSWAVDPFDSPEESLQSLQPLEQGGNASYRVLGLLSNSGRGPVFIGLDVERRRRCVFKSSAKGMTDRPSDGELALRREAALLGSLPAHGAWPAVYDLIETDEQLMIVTEDVEGVSLGERIADSTAGGSQLSPSEVVDLALEIGRAVEALHREGVIHRDLKSSNVLVRPTGGVALIDFEHAGRKQERVGSGGTRGYMSPQQRAGQPTSESDDVYALGALLMLLATSCEPSQAPDAADLTTRPLELLRPDLPPSLARLIRSCLSTEPGCRPRDATEFISLLTDFRKDDLTASPSRVAGDTRASNCPATAAIPDPLGTAQELCDALCNRAAPGPDGTLTWISTSPGTLPVPYRQINNGVPGVLLGLASGWWILGRERHRDTLTRGARWLMESEELPGAKISGLYAGEAGVGASLLVAGLACGDRSFLDGAYEVERRLRQYPFDSVDLYHGTAGRLRFLAMLWSLEQDRDVLEHALRCAEHLHATAVAPSDGLACWQGDENTAGVALASYAHGTAGVADALLDLYEITRDARHLDLVDRAVRWVSSAAVPSLHDGSGTDWGNGGAFGGLWCYGASGVGLLYLHLMRVRTDPNDEDIARRAGNTTAFAGRYAGPGLCHGLGGSIEYLLDLHQLTGDPAWLRHSSDLQRLLHAYRRSTPDGIGYPSTQDHPKDSSYMLGDAGLVGTMLRQGTDGQLPRMLSIASVHHLAKPPQMRQTQGASGPT